MAAVERSRRPAQFSVPGDIFADDSGGLFGTDAPQDAQDSHDLNRQAENDNRFCSTPSREVLTLPLLDYVKYTLDFCRQLEEERSDDCWRSPLFDFARFCRAHPDITALPDNKAMQEVEKIMVSLSNVPDGCDPWEHFFPEGEYGETLSGDEARLDFMTSWGSVRHVPFRDVLHDALRLSLARPLTPVHMRGKLYQRFISLAGWLQKLRSGYTIYLPTRTIAEVLKCDQRTVSRLRRLATEDNLLTVVKEHTFRPTGKGEATEFRFALEHFEELRGER